MCELLYVVQLKQSSVESVTKSDANVQAEKTQIHVNVSYFFNVHAACNASSNTWVRHRGGTFNIIATLLNIKTMLFIFSRQDSYSK